MGAKFPRANERPSPPRDRTLAPAAGDTFATTTTSSAVTAAAVACLKDATTLAIAFATATAKVVLLPSWLLRLLRLGLQEVARLRGGVGEARCGGAKRRALAQHAELLVWCLCLPRRRMRCGGVAQCTLWGAEVLLHLYVRLPRKGAPVRVNKLNKAV